MLPLFSAMVPSYARGRSTTVLTVWLLADIVFQDMLARLLFYVFILFYKGIFWCLGRSDMDAIFWGRGTGYLSGAINLTKVPSYPLHEAILFFVHTYRFEASEMLLKKVIIWLVIDFGLWLILESCGDYVAKRYKN